jgi:hypothetical protein
MGLQTLGDKLAGVSYICPDPRKEKSGITLNRWATDR